MAPSADEGAKTVLDMNNDTCDRVRTGLVGLLLGTLLLGSFLVPGSRGAVAASEPGEKEVARADAGVARVQQEKRKFLDALTAFIKALEGYFAVDGNRVWQGIASMHRALTQWDEAIRTLETALASKPPHPAAHIALGRAHLERSRLDDALRELGAAVRLDPGRAEAHTLLGVAYSHAGRAAEAIEAFRKAIARDPEDLTASYSLAQNLLKLGRREQAHKALEAFAAAQEKRSRGAAGEGPRTGFATVDDPATLLQRLPASEPVFAPLVYRQGFAFLKEGKYGDALAAFRGAAALDPLSDRAYFAQSDAYEKLDKLEDALEATRQAIHRHATDARHHYQLGELHLALNQKDEARLAFERAVSLDGSLLGGRLHLAGLALHAGKTKDAVSYLERAVHPAPDDAEARRFLGLAFWADRQYEKSLEQLRTAIRLNPRDERARMALARVLYVGQRSDDVEQALKEAIQAIPGLGVAHYSLGRLYYNKGRRDEALKELERASELGPVIGLDRLRLHIARLHVSQLKIDDAVGATRRVLEINPNSASAHRFLADVYVRRNRYTEALAELFAISVLDADARTTIAQVYLRTGRYAGAETHARKALALIPDHRQGRYTLASALMRLGRTDEGRQEMQKFQRLQSEAQAGEHRQRDLMALNQEALASFQKGDDEKAIALLQKAIEREPTGSAPYLHLAMIHVKSGRYEDAVKSLEKAAELNPLSAEIRRYLAEAYRLAGKTEDSMREQANYVRMREERLQGMMESR